MLLDTSGILKYADFGLSKVEGENLEELFFKFAEAGEHWNIQSADEMMKQITTSGPQLFSLCISYSTYNNNNDRNFFFLGVGGGGGEAKFGRFKGTLQQRHKLAGKHPKCTEMFTCWLCIMVYLIFVQQKYFSLFFASSLTSECSDTSLLFTCDEQNKDSS